MTAEEITQHAKGNDDQRTEESPRRTPINKRQKERAKRLLGKRRRSPSSERERVTEP